MPNIAIIVAIADHNAIGRKNDLLTYISSDLKRFKALTTGHTIIMGRKTFDSLPKGALPNRRNVVISRNTDLQIEGAEVVNSPEAALSLCSADEKVFVIGGATIYDAFLPKADILNLTVIDYFFNDADTFFPEINYDDWDVVNKEVIEDDEKTNFTYSFIDLQRK
ncbi:dihydrofolate reductase [Saccharicrinis aurantiacus]|uniref:dihydrofolate reductase n=1 Tax=Saccharicrinis aurantiacus TaxID=1849719 RepID=UPI002492BE96|nr:dihydrofolate reductase [Saccharicrinis aurantiacus]